MALDPKTKKSIKIALIVFSTVLFVGSFVALGLYLNNTGSIDGISSTTAPPPPTSVPRTSVPPTTAPPTSAPRTSVPPTQASCYPKDTIVRTCRRTTLQDPIECKQILPPNSTCCNGEIGYGNPLRFAYKCK